MAFDNTNPADLAALKAEYENDPVPPQGYRSPIDHYANGSVRELTDLINADAADGETKNSADFNGFDYAEAVGDNTGSAPAEKIEVLGAGPATQAAITNAASPQAALAEQNAAEADRAANLINIEFFRDFRERVIPFRFKEELLSPWTGLVAGNRIRQSIIALGTGPKSRAEQLFGDGTVISRQDTERALAFEG